MSSLKIYRSSECDLTLLRGKQITVVGYGSQGKAFALNLSDSGCSVQVALRDDSRTKQQVFADRLPLRSFDSVGKSDIVVFAFPDHEQPAFHERYLLSHAKRPLTMVFLHGLNVHFGNIAFSPRHDVILVAPHGPGTDLRAGYLSGRGLSCFLAVHQNASGNAHDIGLAIAAGIGADKAGIYETNFRDEAIGDLFGEQTLLVGGLAGLTSAVFETMVAHGIPPQNAYLETVSQLKLLAAMVEQYGPVGMIERVSKTAGFGSLLAMAQLFDDQFRVRLESVYQTVDSGAFNKLLTEEARNGFATLAKQLASTRESECQKACDQENVKNDDESGS